MSKSSAKMLGQFFTPQEVASTLVRWVVRTESDKMLDPSCGDGRFVCQHRNSVGVDLSDSYCFEAQGKAPWAEIRRAEFFSWADKTKERFECVAGNPPFIRYQNFQGDVRDKALEMCAREGAIFSALTSSWAPFVVIAGSLLKAGGRMAFIIPAEIGHATYAAPLLDSLVNHFGRVVIVAIKRKIFPQLSEDVWLLYAEDRGGTSRYIELAAWESFVASPYPPDQTKRISLETLSRHGKRLRKFLLPDYLLDYYSQVSERPGIVKFGGIARISIGYVTGANNFFHLRPSDAENLGIPLSVLKIAVRKGEQLPKKFVGKRVVRSWLDADEPVLLLDLSQVERLPNSVEAYLDSEAAHKAKESYKCRNRDPWYVVPDVYPPDVFLSYMSGKSPNLVSNPVKCVCTNSVHAVRLIKRLSIVSLLKAWENPLCNLSKEIEGHPLGGGLLKLEPGEASKILLPIEFENANNLEERMLKEGIDIAKSWRHCG